MYLKILLLLDLQLIVPLQHCGYFRTTIPPAPTRRLCEYKRKYKGLINKYHKKSFFLRLTSYCILRSLLRLVLNNP